MNDVTLRIVAELAAGHFCSGPQLAQILGISRTAVWKHIQRLADYGVEVFSVPGKGYRLATPIQLLDQARLCQAIADGENRFLGRLEILSSIDSTNSHLRELANRGEPNGTVLIAEHQTGGRGRRGRRWVSPFACNLYCSVLWRFADVQHGLGGLSLAIGVALVDALESIGVRGVQLKWPNDLLYNGRKLAGILLEMSGDPTGSGYLVIGFGINVAMSKYDIDDDIDQPWIDLRQISGDEVCRNQLAVCVLQRVDRVIEVYQQSGLQHLVERWNQLDVMQGRAVTVSGPAGDSHGIAKGIDENGALLLLQGETICRIHSGEVSLRLAEQ